MSARHEPKRSDREGAIRNSDIGSRTWAAFRQSQGRCLLQILVAVFLIETAVMMLLPLVLPEGFPSWGEALGGGALLTPGITPLVWVLVLWIPKLAIKSP